MDRHASKDRHLRKIVERSQYWDVDDLMRNFDRELDQLEHGLGHMIWDMKERIVTTRLLPLPVTPNFHFSEDSKEFKLVVKLPGVSRESIRLNVDARSVELLACSGDVVCKPYYISVDATGELVPDSAEAELSGGVFEVRVKKTAKRRLVIK